MSSVKNHRFLSGGEAVVESFKVEKVRKVFGLIGSATMELFDSLYDCKDIKFIDVRDERTGTHMADGYARASGEPGIIIAGQNGPGATNLVTGVAQAAAAFSPVISIAGAISSEHKGKDAFQEIDQQSIFEPITKKTWTINETKKIPQIFNEAFKLSLQPRCGPVHVNLPRDILSNKENFMQFNKHKLDNHSAVKNEDIIKVIRLISNSLKPVIIVGAGIKNNGIYQDVVNLAKIIGSPIVSSAGHGDAIPANEELYMGQMGPRGNILASRSVKESDLILAIGTRLGFNSTFFSNNYIRENIPIIQVDIEQKSLGRYFPVSIGLCTDANEFVKKLCDEITLNTEVKNIKDWLNSLIIERKMYLKKRDKSAELNKKPIQPSALFKILRDVMPKESAITLDAGTLCLQATDSLNYFKPPCLFTPLDFGLVGFSFACGLGVKLANPDRPVISLMGDGGFGMTISELSTAVEHKINTVTLVLNNQSWGAEKAYQRDFFDCRYIGSNIKSPEFDKIAELYGAKGYKVENVSDIGDSINAALKCDKPAIINISIDPNKLFSFRSDSFKHRSK